MKENKRIPVYVWMKTKKKREKIREREGVLRRCFSHTSV